MNLDANVQKIIFALIKKWKLLVIFTLIGVLAAYVFTSNFTTLTYTSTVEFLAYAVDSSDEIDDSSTTSSSTTSGEIARSSNTSKMNYAMKMLDTYIEVMNTNGFSTKVAEDLNERLSSSYTPSMIHSAMTIEAIENTAMFKITVTTTDANLSYEIAQQLETTVPKMLSTTNSGLVQATVEDKPIKALNAGSRGYLKKCLLGAILGFAIAAAYVILRSFLDIRIKSGDELVERYDIPILGTVPSFDLKGADKKKGAK